MPGETGINWTELSWGLFTGCSRCASECVNCYAELLAGTDPKLKETPRYKDLTVIRGDGRPHWTGEVRFWPNVLTWAIRKGKPSLIFTNSMSDPFHENVNTDWQDKFFAAMLIGNQHIYQVLTKRPSRMAAYINDPNTRSRVFAEARTLWANQFSRKTKQKPAGIPYPVEKEVWPLPHVWLGCSAGSQKSADRYIPELLEIPYGWLLWVSAEPLIGPVSLRPQWIDGTRPRTNFVQWIVAGGESGKKEDARPMLPSWAEALRTACRDAGVAYWWKQPGNWQVMSPEDRARFLADTEFMEAAVYTGKVCGLNAENETVRGLKVASETLRDNTVLFWYETKKGGDSIYRTFPTFPATFARADELTALRPNRNLREEPPPPEEPTYPGLLAVG